MAKKCGKICKVKNKLGDAKVAAKKELVALKKKAKAFEVKATTYAKENPAKVAAISAAVGAIIGAAVATLARRKK